MFIPEPDGLMGEVMNSVDFLYKTTRWSKTLSVIPKITVWFFCFIGFTCVSLVALSLFVH